MQSKISFFNKTVFKKNLTRFWPYAVLYALYLILVHPLILYVSFGDTGYEMSAEECYDIAAKHFVNTTEPFSIFIAAIVVAVAVFGYLYQSRSANMLHTFPVTRTELFVTNYVSGFVLMVVPQLAAALAMNFVLLGKVNGLVWAVWTWFAITVGETIFFFGFACFVVMFTGQRMAAPLFYLIWNFLYITVVGLINATADLLVFGLSGSLVSPGNHPLIPVVWMNRRVGFNDSRLYDEGARTITACGIPMLVIYAVAGLLFAAAAFYVYRKRQLEGAGDFLTVRWTKPLFRWGAAVVGGVAGAICLTLIMADGRGFNRAAGTFVIFLVIASAVLFFVAEMFIEKSFRVFKRQIAVECVSCVAVLLVGVALLQFDVFGYESYVPETSEVKLVMLDYNTACFDSEEDIDKVRKLHELLLSHKSELKGNQSNVVAEDEIYEYIRIQYQLKNGKDVVRAYGVKSKDVAFMEELQGQFYALLSDPEAIKRSYFGMNYEELDWQVTSADLEYAAGDSDEWNMISLYGTESELQELYDAVILDIEAGAFAPGGVDYYDGKFQGTLSLDLWTNMSEEDIQYASCNYLRYLDSGRAAGSNMSCYLELNLNCTNTIDTLIRQGWIDNLEDLR